MKSTAHRKQTSVGSLQTTVVPPTVAGSGESHTTAGRLVPDLETGSTMESLNLEKANADSVHFLWAKHKAKVWIVMNVFHILHSCSPRVHPIHSKHCCLGC